MSSLEACFQQGAEGEEPNVELKNPGAGGLQELFEAHGFVVSTTAIEEAYTELQWPETKSLSWSDFGCLAEHLELLNNTMNDSETGVANANGMPSSSGTRMPEESARNGTEPNHSEVAEKLKWCEEFQKEAEHEEIQSLLDNKFQQYLIDHPSDETSESL